MRKVMVQDWAQDTITRQWERKEKGEAIFHQFGVGYEEFVSGRGNYSTAIVEWPDGKIENIPIYKIKYFVNEG